MANGYLSLLLLGLLAWPSVLKAQMSSSWKEKLELDYVKHWLSDMRKNRQTRLIRSVEENSNQHFMSGASNRATSVGSGPPLSWNTDRNIDAEPGKQLYDWESILLRHLFSPNNYNSEVRPARSPANPVIVTIELVLLQINELVDKDQQIIISGFLKINWDDERLSWESEEHAGIKWIVTSARNVWLPDIALINSDDVYSVTRDGRFPVSITKDGQILYVPAGKIRARCELDLRYFPFDEQLCYYRFESWVYSAELVKIIGVNFTLDNNHYVENHQWEIRHPFVNTRIVPYESYNFSRVEFYMVLRRKSLFFITYTIFPCLALSTLQICSHMLPFTEPERINFATTTLIAFSVFHVSIVEQMPQSSHAIPLLAIYIDALMCLIGLSLLECFVMMNWLSRVGYSVPSPRLWFYVVDRWGDYLMLGSNGAYWRRNYLRILEAVNLTKSRQNRKRASEVKQWTSTSRRDKESYINRFSHFRENNPSRRETDALILLMNHWGYSYGHLDYDKDQNAVKVSTTQEDDDMPPRNELTHRKNKSRQADNTTKRKCWSYKTTRKCNSVDSEYPEMIPLTKTTRELDEPPSSKTYYDPCSSAVSQRTESATSPQRGYGKWTFQSLKEISSHRKGYQSEETCKCGIVIPDEPASERSRRRQTNDDCKLSRYAGDDRPGSSKMGHYRNIRPSSPSQACSVVSFNNESKQFETRTTTTHLQPRLTFGDSPARSTSPNSQAASSKSQRQNLRRSQRAHAHLNTLINISDVMEHANYGFQMQTLRRECIGVWTTFITVIDRFMSLLLMLLCIAMPTYLFILFPASSDLSELKTKYAKNFE